MKTLHMGALERTGTFPLVTTETFDVQENDGVEGRPPGGRPGSLYMPEISPLFCFLRASFVA